MCLCVFFFIVYWGYVPAFDFPRIGLRLGSGFKLACGGWVRALSHVAHISFIIYSFGFAALDSPRIGLVLCWASNEPVGGWVASSHVAHKYSILY